MKQELESHFEEFEKKTVTIRRKLLPWWIKAFCWIFMLLGIGGIGALLGTLFIPYIHLSLYGLTSNYTYSTFGLIIIAIILLKAYAAYLLWFEKDNAILIGKTDAVLGIVICFISMFAVPYLSENSHFDFRLEIVLLIPYYLKLYKIEDEWENE